MERTQPKQWRSMQVVFFYWTPSVCSRQPGDELLCLNEEISPADVFGRCLLASLPVCDEPHTFFTNGSRWLIYAVGAELATGLKISLMLWFKARDNNCGTCFFSLCLYRIYYWYDEKGKKTKCTAPQYVDFVMSLCQKLVTDEEIFPTKYGESLCVEELESVIIREVKMKSCTGRANNRMSNCWMTVWSFDFSRGSKKVKAKIVSEKSWIGLIKMKI